MLSLVSFVMFSTKSTFLSNTSINCLIKYDLLPFLFTPLFMSSSFNYETLKLLKSSTLNHIDACGVPEGCTTSNGGVGPIGWGAVLINDTNVLGSLLGGRVGFIACWGANAVISTGVEFNGFSWIINSPSSITCSIMYLSHCLYHTLHPHHHYFVHVLSLVRVFLEYLMIKARDFMVFGCLNWPDFPVQQYWCYH